ncbi:MAG TPA: hypothetical protein VK487_06270 [Candidatus Bathyarchaeia archaeon]|nr:hypothetical protein [Candidatus Bathyarchaeia archaeon]
MSINIAFRGFRIRPSNVKLARDKVTASFGLCKIEMLPINAYGVVDEDFEIIRTQKFEGKDIDFEKLMNFTEWGRKYSVKDVNAFTRLYCTDGSYDRIHHADIFIRASIYEKDKAKFYDALEHEVMHCLLGAVIPVYRQPATAKKPRMKSD